MNLYETFLTFRPNETGEVNPLVAAFAELETLDTIKNKLVSLFDNVQVYSKIFNPQIWKMQVNTKPQVDFKMLFRKISTLPKVSDPKAQMI